MALVKRKVACDESDIASEKPTEETAQAQADNSVLALVPNKGPRRQRGGKKNAARGRRVKNPAPTNSQRELTPEEALAQAWEYTYQNRGKFRQ